MASVNSDSSERKRGIAVLLHYLAWTVDKLGVLLLHESRFSRLIRRPVWKRAYSTYCRDCLTTDFMAFLNLGYLTDSDEVAGSDVDGIADRLSERLYDQIVGDTDLKGKSAIEVGCGPGAGSAYLTRTRSPASFVGIDLNKDLIAWCHEHHDLPNLRFLQGDAQDLPIESGSVDAVVNLESSHCYPSRLRFFEEVTRVLRPGGSFLFADVIVTDPAGDAPGVVSTWLNDAGLTIEDCIDITDNVLAARDVVSRSPSFLSRMRGSLPLLTVPLVEQALYLHGTTTYKRLASGGVRYMQWKASKPHESSSVSSTADAVGSIAG
jgi:SAM-dependent methyltransferase